MQAFHIFDFFSLLFYILKTKGEKSMYSYEIIKGTILKSKVNGKYYVVDSREDVNEYDWYFSVRQIASNVSREELIACKIEDLSLSEKRIKLPNHQRFCFDMVRSVFPKLEGRYYAEDGTNRVCT